MKKDTQKYIVLSGDGEFYSKFLESMKENEENAGVFKIRSLNEAAEVLKDARQGVVFMNVGQEAAPGSCELPAWRTMEHTLRTESEVYQDIAYIKKYIRLHLDEELTRRTLARKLCLTPNYLSNVFKKHENESIGRFIARSRIERGAYLLLTEDTRVQDIAARTGFSDASYFCKSFKKHYGVTPLRYRAMHRKIVKNSSRRPDGNRVEALR